MRWAVASALLALVLDCAAASAQLVEPLIPFERSGTCRPVAAPDPGAAASDAPVPPLEPAPITLAPTAPEPPKPWAPPPPVPRAKDWIQLDSGEVVLGDIEQIKDEEVYFDSDELDDLEIDWDDVARFGSARLNTYRFGDRTIVTGTAAMSDGVIRIATGDQICEFPRGDLYSMIEGDPRELNYWSFDGSVGVTLRSGNSDQSDVSTHVALERETPLTKASLSYEGAYSEVQADEVTNNHRVIGQFNYYVTQRTFLIVPYAEFYRDRLINVALRSTLATGAGYEIVDRPRAEWGAMLAFGYQRTRFHDVQPGEPDSSNDAAVLLGTQLELDPHKDVDWDTTYRVAAVVTDFAKTSHHLTSVLSFDLWGPVDFDLRFVWDRIEDPEPDANGEIPASDDFRLTAELGLEF